MTRLTLRLLPLALVALVAACGSDKAPEAAKAADAAPTVDPAKRVAQPLTAPPVHAEPQGIYANAPLPKPGDMTRFGPVGVIECDQFAEKARQCLNAGVLPPDERQSAAVELRKILGTAKGKFSVDDRRAFCADAVMKLQPKLITAGCQNL